MSREWMSQAYCRDDTKQSNMLDLFFPESFEREEDRLQRESLAKAICAQCVVRTECLNYALTYEQQSDGVWGGLNKEERGWLIDSKAS